MDSGNHHGSVKGLCVCLVFFFACLWGFFGTVMEITAHLFQSYYAYKLCQLEPNDHLNKNGFHGCKVQTRKKKVYIFTFIAFSRHLYPVKLTHASSLGQELRVPSV